jgi:hypothetical protein
MRGDSINKHPAQEILVAGSKPQRRFEHPGLVGARPVRRAKRVEKLLGRDDGVLEVGESGHGPTIGAPTYRGPTEVQPAAQRLGDRTLSGRVVTSLRLELRPSIPECERAVEDECIRCRVGIGAEVAEPLELHGLADRNLRE